MTNHTDLTITRVRHQLKFRLLQVAAINQVSPTLVRITLSGDDLEGFTSASFDDHVKVFLPAPGQNKPVVPTLGPDGPSFPADQPRPTARDYTPRRFNAADNTLELEFALHDAGPATEWASQAKVGDYLGVGGPRGSMVIPTGFDWHVLIGDDTALPAIARRLEELPATAQALVVVEVANAECELTFNSAAALTVRWSHRDGSTAGLLDTVKQLELPTAGEGYVWAAGEFSSIRAVRQYLTEERGVDKRRIRAASYWKQGDSAVHERFED